LLPEADSGDQQADRAIAAERYRAVVDARKEKK